MRVEASFLPFHPSMVQTHLGVSYQDSMYLDMG